MAANITELMSFDDVRPKPDMELGRFALCKHMMRGRCRHGNQCTYAHSREELRVWNNSSRRTSRQPVQQPVPPSSLIHQPLSVENYKEKFILLIEAEREEHRGHLKQRCKGKYRYTNMGKRCPNGLKVKNPKQYKMYGRLDGISCEDFAYVKQASSSVTLERESVKVTADLCYHKNKAENLYCLFLAFRNFSEKFCSSFEVSVEFNLKESYFKDLINSVNCLQVVHRLVPNLFLSVEHPKNLDVCEIYCSAEQFDALKIIVNSPPQSPPILLTGAFGTGKSRLLAICALYLLSKKSHQPVRILVCTQQRFSADKFLDYYISIVWENKNDNVFVVRDYGYGSLESEKKNYYTSSEVFKDFVLNRKKSGSMLVITTCLTAPHLYGLPEGFFNYIFIDEGSHMREPEAVAPLWLATNSTKIVIAGDTNQVGPANLVRGTVARANYLNISLLQRLEKLYLSSPSCQITVRLSHNYRCHPVILELVSELFYDSHLKWHEQEAQPTTHRQYQYPLVFICSGINTSTLSTETQELEAEIITDKVMELAKQTPPTWNCNKPMKNFLITSPCENQISGIYKKFKAKKIADLPEIRTVFQGQEYQAVILSTTEPVNQDGSTLDETKSFCDPYVFNTAVTRAKSLVIAIGNPFLLLNMEKSFVRMYGDIHNAHCWSTYIHHVLKKGSFEFDARLKLSDDLKLQVKEQIRTEISGIQKLKRLAEENLALQGEKSKLLQEVKDKDTLLEDKDKEIEMLKRQLQDHRQEVRFKTPPSQQSPEETSKAVPDTSLKATGKGIEQTPTQGGRQMIVQDDFQRTFVRRLSIEHSDRTFEMMSLLGKGGFAQVYHVFEAESTEKYALKVICCNRESKKILKEVDALQKLEHERIVRYVTHWVREDHQGWWTSSKDSTLEGNQYLFILTELCKNDTLYHWLKKNSGSNCRPLELMKSYFIQILDGLIFIHEKDYVHRDLKPSNIFFSLENDNLKIGDFGLVMEETSHNVIQSQNMDSFNTASTFEGCGTPIYISPEQKRKGQVDSKTDIYALGIILFELFYPKAMTSEERYEVLEKIPIGDFPQNFRNMFPEVYGIIIKMVENTPSSRLSAKEVQLSFNQLEFSSEFVSVCDE